MLVLASWMCAAPVAAGTVWRCVGADGIPNYTSKRSAGAVCKAVAQGTSRVSPATPVASAPAITPTVLPAGPAAATSTPAVAGVPAKPDAPKEPKAAAAAEAKEEQAKA